MNIKCMFGIHNWSKNCEKCANCKATRKDRHQVQGCQCSICGSAIHAWGAEKKIAPLTYEHTCQRCGAAERSVMIDCSDPDEIEASLRLLGLGGR